MPKPIEQKGIAGQTEMVRRTYDKYGGMLLGYLAQTLNDRRLAEECLTIIFTELGMDAGAAVDKGWLQLRAYAKIKLTELGLHRQAAGATLAVPEADGLWLNMTEQQRCVFYNAYHCGKPIAAIARQLGEPETHVKKVLAEAFAIIRKS